MVSVVDPESRHVHKTQHSYRDGYKAHIGIEPDTGLITASDLTPGNVGDAEAAVALIEEEPAGTEVLADSAYGSGELRRSLAGHHTRRSSSRCRCTMRSREASASTTSSSTRRPERSPAPMGSPSPSLPPQGRLRRELHGLPGSSPLHEGEEGRSMTSTSTTTALAARRVAETDEFQAIYRQHRPMIERSIAWLVAKGNRKVSYRGIERNQIWLAHRAPRSTFAASSTSD